MDSRVTVGTAPRARTTDFGKDLSALAPNTQHAEMRDFRQMLILNFHCNLDFGTQRREHGKRINNEDKENGILSGTK